MTARRKRRQGVTLIELLIAITLVSMLSAGMLWAIRAGLGAMDRTNARTIASRRVLGANRVLEQQVAGLIPALAPCAGRVKRVLFQGAPAAMRFVSSHSLEEAARGYPRLLEYTVIPGDQGVGVRLIVNEILYTGPELLEFFCTAPSVEPRPDSFILADRLQSCSFSYLFIDSQNGARAWFPVWDRAGLPAAIRVEMLPLEPDPSRLQMATMTLPVRPDRPAEIYTDVDPPLQ